MPTEWSDDAICIEKKLSPQYYEMFHGELAVPQKATTKPNLFMTLLAILSVSGIHAQIIIIHG